MKIELRLWIKCRKVNFRIMLKLKIKKITIRLFGE